MPHTVQSSPAPSRKGPGAAALAAPLAKRLTAIGFAAALLAASLALGTGPASASPTEPVKLADTFCRPIAAGGGHEAGSPLPAVLFGFAPDTANGGGQYTPYRICVEGAEAALAAEPEAVLAVGR